MSYTGHLTIRSLEFTVENFVKLPSKYKGMIRLLGVLHSTFYFSEASGLINEPTQEPIRGHACIT